ncbi:MAG: cold shock domain-containing protein [Anaerolinea sp.]|nr:cold shock domain-containing protein [Anaerolinea sp.]MCC6976022.1 cold shock domain-containing protein [Anaerolineae bacterium]CAG0957377.1 Cold shock-like protein [Anaerolineae bacterium]
MPNSSTRCQGTVHNFDRISGRGIIVTDTGREVMVRYSAIQGQGKRDLKPGDRVTLEIEQNGSTETAVHVVRQP